jgi:hypothetical protein
MTALPEYNIWDPIYQSQTAPSGLLGGMQISPMTMGLLGAANALNSPRGQTFGQSLTGAATGFVGGLNQAQQISNQRYLADLKAKNLGLEIKSEVEDLKTTAQQKAAWDKLKGDPETFIGLSPVQIETLKSLDYTQGPKTLADWRKDPVMPSNIREYMIATGKKPSDEGFFKGYLDFVQAKRPLTTISMGTEGQHQAATFYDRMVSADKIISLEGVTAALSAPIAGTAQGIAPRVLQTTEYQLGDTSAKDFAGAILRKESGAAITEKEIEDAKLIYIPIPGDSPETIALKARNRQAAAENMRRQAGPAIKSPEGLRDVPGVIIPGSGSGGTGPGIGTDIPGGPASSVPPLETGRDGGSPGMGVIPRPTPKPAMQQAQGLPALEGLKTSEEIRSVPDIGMYIQWAENNPDNPQAAQFLLIIDQILKSEGK